MNIMPSVKRDQWERICLLFTICAFAFKFILSFTTEFTIDEVYYTVWARHWQWSYFDHPAAIAWLQRLTTFNGHLMTELTCRIGPMICSVIQALMVFRITEAISDRKAAWLGVLAYSAMPYGSIISGWMVMPDVPLMTAWLLAMAQMVRILQKPEETQFSISEGVILGITLALAVSSKVQSLFLGLGIGILSLHSHRQWWKKTGWYAAMFIGASGIIPQVWWNIRNGSPMTSYHSSRLGSTIHPDHLFSDFFAGWVYQNPLVMVLLIGGCILWVKGHPFRTNVFTRLFLFISMPLLVTFMGVSLISDSLPHWTGPAYLSLLPMAAAGAMRSANPIRFLNWTKAGWWLLQGIMALIVIYAIWFPGSMGDQKMNTRGSGDLTLDFTGWKAWKLPLSDALQQDTIIGKHPNDVWLLSGFHFPAAQIEFYHAHPLNLRTKVVGEFNSIHNFYYTNQILGELAPGDNAVWMDITNYDRKLPDALKLAFNRTGETIWIPQIRNGATVRYLRITPLYNYQGGIPASGLLTKP